ncbi:MAG: bifunctional aspartate kinase/homoserine dehydrogenase I [Flavobacteriaceae bacterium]|nr:bifunctional aspartate kinase/homoserine dehydrogenase I [Flavobacteriaceae bacterium]
MIVSKFGGTSVGSAENINKVIQIISDKNKKTAVVVSAFGGITNLLIKASDIAVQGNKEYIEIIKEIQKKHIDTIEVLFDQSNQIVCKDFVTKHLHKLKDILNGVFLLRDLSDKSAAKIVSTGEILSSFIIAEAMKTKGLNASLKDSRKLIKTDSSFNNAAINYNLTYKNIQQFFSNNKEDIVVLPGFIASDKDNETTTLGRGGSDFTAAIIANAVNAEILEIWTDVSGMFTANPKLVKQAKPIKKISYQEAMELSHFGAKVIYPPTIQPVLSKKIPIAIKNTLAPNDKGTLITESINNYKSTVKGISHIENIALLTLEGNGMVGVPGISKRLFEALAQENINIKFITQASSEHSICIAIDLNEAESAKVSVDKQFEFEILQQKVNPLTIENDLAIIALVGDNMKSHQGISGKMFSELGNNNVNIRAIAQGSTEKNISAVIVRNDVKKALNTLHAVFFENQIKQINLFVIGIGNVGGKLLEQIKQQQKYLLNHLHLNIRVIAISNSKNMLFNTEGIDLNNWNTQLNEHGEKANLNEFYKNVNQLNLRNSVFVDNTANDLVPKQYAKYLKDSVAVVACNKIACSSEYDTYKNLKYLSRKYNAPFLFETNVGAGLPIIDTLNNLIASGDEITEIQAVLSGSLNFIFNNFDANSSFYDVVQQAGIEGYTEPDPRIDLSGVDVMRKILILMRESGNQIELNDIKNDSFLPKTSLKADSVTSFLETLKHETNYFEALREAANKKDCKLKYVAEFKNGKAKVGLQHIAKDHPFYNLDGKDNIVLFYTNRYKDQPLIIKGAGAGADVTASGIFGDIIRTGNK